MNKLITFADKLNQEFGEQFAKVTKPIEEHDEPMITIMGLEGRYDEEESLIDFTENVAPSDLEDSDSPDTLNHYLTDHIKQLQALSAFVTKMEKYITYVNGDFYWREGDLNVRIEIKL